MVPVFYAVLCVGRILGLSANPFSGFCLLFCILLCGSYGSDKLSSNYSSVFGISYRSRQQAYRLNMCIIVQTQAHIFLYDRQLELDGLEPLAVRLPFLIDLDFG